MRGPEQPVDLPPGRYQATWTVWSDGWEPAADRPRLTMSLAVRSALPALDRFSGPAQAALRWAEIFRQKVGAKEVCTEYLLAGLYQESTGPTRRLLTLFDDHANIQIELETLVNKMTGTGLRQAEVEPPASGLPQNLSANLETALLRAVEVADAQGSASIDSRHLLAGLLAVPDTVATQWMAKTLQVDRETLSHLVAQAPGEQLPLDGIRRASDRGKPYRTLLGHRELVRAISFSPDMKTVISGGNDGTVRLWDLQSGKERGVLKGHAASVTAVGVRPDGLQAFSESEDNTLKRWDLETKKEIHSSSTFYEKVLAVASASHNWLAVTGSSDHTLRVWDFGLGISSGPLKGHTGGVSAVSVTPDGRRAVSGSSDHTLRVWDLESGRELRTLKGHTGGVSAVSVTPDGRRAVSGSSDHTLKVWDLETGRELRTLKGHAGEVFAVSVTPDGRRAVSGSSDHTLKVWDIETGQEMGSHKTFRGEVLAVVLSPDGRTLAVAIDRVVEIWDLEQLIAQGREPEVPLATAYRLLLATSRAKYTVGERIRVHIQLQRAQPSDPGAFQLPAGTGELHCFADSGEGLQVIEPGAASIVLSPSADHPLVATIELQAALPGSRSCSFNLFADEARLSLEDSRISVEISPPLAGEERLFIIPTLDVRVAARPEVVLQVELGPTAGRRWTRTT